ncbi:MAG: YggS family pyridoxal phosphate-dependent enzyme, partial [Sciscionella sp.]
MPDPSTRLAELSGRLAEVRERIAGAARRSGRQPSDVTLVVVTKTWPLADVGALFDLGVRDFGESRHPEAQHKAAGLGAAEARWHFIGQLQSNKAVPVAAYADVVHSVDSVRLAHRLNAGAHR